MTTGQLLFYAGIATLVLTVLLAVVFLVKKPRYDPESAAHSANTSQTQKLRNGYPTDRLTIRREPRENSVPSAVPAERGTERIEEIGANALQTAAAERDGALTERISETGTFSPAGADTPGGLGNATVPLDASAEMREVGTELLTDADTSTATEEQNETVML